MTQAQTEEDSGEQQVPAGAGLQDGEQPEDALPEINLRVVVLGGLAILTFLVSVALVMHFKPGGAVLPNGVPQLDVFSAGPVAQYPPGTITYFEREHLHLVRLSDGALLALYDLDPRMQAMVEQGDEDSLRCRVQIYEDDSLPRLLYEAGIRPLPGFEQIGFHEPCHGGIWDAQGRFVVGPPNGDLDRFPVGTLNNIVRVDLVNRRCVNPVTPETPCIPTQ